LKQLKESLTLARLLGREFLSSKLNWSSYIKSRERWQALRFRVSRVGIEMRALAKAGKESKEKLVNGNDSFIKGCLNNVNLFKKVIKAS
jgi:hypothetical protein